MNKLYRHIQKDLITHKLTANFKNEFFLDIRNSFLNKIQSFYWYIKKIRKLESCKDTYVQTQRLSETDIKLTRVGWVIAEKIWLNRLFPFQDVISFTLNVKSGSGGMLIFDVPPDMKACECFALAWVPLLTSSVTFLLKGINPFWIKNYLWTISLCMHETDIKKHLFHV